MNTTSVFLCLLLASCSLGPVQITHEDGSLPRVQVNLPSDNCKLKPKVTMRDKSVSLVCKVPI